MTSRPATTNRRAVLAAVALAGTAAAVPLARPALAQGRFPERPIRLFCPWAPGGTTDVQMRALAEALSRRVGQPVVIENKPGAGGILGAQALLNERPDGYTLSQMPISVFRAPHTMARPPFEPLRDFTWVAHLTGYLFGVAVRADAPWRTFGEFLDEAARSPGRVAYGTPGVGTSLHITMERIAAERRVEFVHVPFRGFAENVQSLLAGQTGALADSSGWAPLVLDGRLRLLCVWSAERARRFPDVPTLRESGFDIVSTSPYGVAGPRGMDPGVVRVLAEAFREALMDPAHLAVLERFDMAPEFLGPEEYAALAARTEAEERAMIARLGLRPT